MIRIKNILCPVDFFPASLRAYEYALKLASNYDADVHVVHVVSPLFPAAYDFPLNVSEYTGAVQKQARSELIKLAKKAKQARVRFHSELPNGGIDDEIHKALKRTAADLVVMGTHGRRGFERWILGSEADRLLRSCPVPLLTIGAGKGVRTAPPSIKRILVTTDFSPGTSEALKYAFSIAQESQARITLLHVVDQVTVGAVALAPATVDAVRRQLEKLVPAEARPWCEVKTRVENGVPYQTILEIQGSEKADLLVMNVHGKGLLDRALLGSTAERVVRGAVCPVLLIPPAVKAQKGAASKRKTT